MSSKKKTSVRAKRKGPNKAKTDMAREAVSAEIAERIEKLESETSPTRDTAARPGKRRSAKAAGEARESGGGGGLTAAHRVLSEAKEPMRIRDITKAAMDNGWWKPAGKTPWATLAAAMGREIKDKGKQSRFKKTDRGLFIAAQAR